MAWGPVPGSERLTTASLDSNTLRGRGVAVSGDMLRVAGSTVRISGIEAPGYGQVCGSDKSRKWRCDVYAEAALSRLLAGGRIECQLKGTDADGHSLVTCRRGDTDIAAELVAGGHVFAETGLFAPYASNEKKARAAKAGIWAGEAAARPSEYRAQKWEEAKRDAPDGCPIKGNVRGGRRIYVLPWSRGYERVRVSESRGGRWFCSEEEARSAGWQSSEPS
jgi:endonuclease YncB( thermonuclease family)